jgi:hypothetical protein
MVARAVEKSALELKELRREEIADGALAALVFGLSLAATQSAARDLAFPLFAGAVFVLVRFVHASLVRWELVQDLLLDRDAYAIPEVRDRAEQLSSLQSRHGRAATIRHLVEAGRDGVILGGRVAACAEELSALADDLDDAELELDPLAAVLCDRLLVDGGESALYDPALPAEALAGQIRRIRSGFAARAS